MAEPWSSHISETDGKAATEDTSSATNIVSGDVNRTIPPEKRDIEDKTLDKVNEWFLGRNWCTSDVANIRRSRLDFNLYNISEGLIYCEHES